jgi:hypothetical protein
MVAMFIYDFNTAGFKIYAFETNVTLIASEKFQLKIFLTIKEKSNHHTYLIQE